MRVGSIAMIPFDATYTLLGFRLSLAGGLVHVVEQQVDNQSRVGILVLRVVGKKRLEAGKTARVHLRRATGGQGQPGTLRLRDSGGRRTFDVRCVVAMSSFLSSLVGHSTQSCQASDDLSFSEGKG